ncbi:hypothetical protein, partial [Escherichia coli]|uniref:hypothetical protein n=1 Tax=Escherichia coli TaxID=562 RepID=UPI001952F455
TAHRAFTETSVPGIPERGVQDIAEIRDLTDGAVNHVSPERDRASDGVYSLCDTAEITLNPGKRAQHSSADQFQIVGFHRGACNGT